jgi:hypothetical protein
MCGTCEIFRFDCYILLEIYIEIFFVFSCTHPYHWPLTVPQLNLKLFSERKVDDQRLERRGVPSKMMAHPAFLLLMIVPLLCLRKSYRHSGFLLPGQWKMAVRF